MMGDARHRITRLIGFFRSNAARGIMSDMMSVFVSRAKSRLEGGRVAQFLRRPCADSVLCWRCIPGREQAMRKNAGDA
jgi:hypothetical protein